MNRILTTIIVLVGILPAGFAAEETPAAKGVSKPNVIIFYVDDLGWQDLELNDLDDPCPYETPNVKRLAASGMNFTQGYAPAPTCSPSRAGIITGQHPAKLGLTHVHLGSMQNGAKSQRLVAPYLESHLDLDALTLADALKRNGYRTGHSGKWHVGLTASNYGFEVVDQDRGVHRGMEDRTKDFATADDKRYPLSEEKYPPFSDKFPDGISYPYDQVTESALSFMKESGEQPFFLNLCHWMVHWPVLTRNGELLEYYCDKLGQPFPPEPGDMTLPGQQNPYFAAMVTTVDWSLGRVVDFLERTDDPRHPGMKLIDTTYIFFTSDNGGAEVRGPEIISDNYPLKKGKKYAEEGGIRVPLVVSGPGIPAGSEFDGLVNQLDFFPTLLDLTNSSIDAEEREELSGLDISPVLHGRSVSIVDAAGQERDHLFWHFPHNGDASMKSAIRSGDFKLYKRYATNDYELYRLYKDGDRHDLEERFDLAKKPEFRSLVERLAAQLDRSLQANRAELPYLNPYYAHRADDAVSIEGLRFDASSRKASLTARKSGPAIERAYVVFQGAPGSAKVKHRAVEGPALLFGMREAARVAPDGYSVSALVPEGVPAVGFILIDANGYQTYSDIEAGR